MCVWVRACVHACARACSRAQQTGRAAPHVCIQLPRASPKPLCPQAWDIIRYSDVPTPEGCALKVKDPSQPVVRCAAKVGGE